MRGIRLGAGTILPSAHYELQLLSRIVCRNPTRAWCQRALASAAHEPELIHADLRDSEPERTLGRPLRGSNLQARPSDRTDRADAAFDVAIEHHDDFNRGAK